MIPKIYFVKGGGNIIWQRLFIMVAKLVLLAKHWLVILLVNLQKAKPVKH